MKKTHKPLPRKLIVRHETVNSLTPLELHNVQGGGVTGGWPCTIVSFDSPCEK